MSITALKCPSCAADIQVDDEREYGFCSYCGSKIKTRDVVEIRYTGQIQINDKVSLEKQLEDGIAYLKMEDYYKAEKAFFGAIKDYPGSPEGYEMLINTLTRNQQLFLKENIERVTKLADKMLAVAPEDKKDYYMLFREQINIGFEKGMIQQQIDANLVKIGKCNKMIYENRLIFICALVLIVAVRILLPADIVFTYTFSLVAIATGSLFAHCLVRKKKLLKKNKVLEIELEKE